jgi:hypothetical protein
MAYLYTFPNGTTPDVIVPQIVSQVPVVSTGLLVLVFFAVFLGGISRQKSKGYQADYAMWGTVAGISTFLVTLIMGVSSGFVSLTTTVIVLVVTLGFGLWLFLDKRQNEV